MERFSTRFHFCWSCVWDERKALGDGGIGREGVDVRERWRVGWIEETVNSIHASITVPYMYAC